VPPTDVPPTDVPPTDVPPTDVPPTDVPPPTPTNIQTFNLRWNGQFLIIENTDDERLSIASIEMQADGATLSGEDWLNFLSTDVIQPDSCLLLYVLGNGEPTSEDILDQIDSPQCDARIAVTGFLPLVGIAAPDAVWLLNGFGDFDVYLDDILVQECEEDTLSCEVTGVVSGIVPTPISNNTVLIEAVWNENTFTLSNTSLGRVSLASMVIEGNSGGTEFDVRLFNNGNNLGLNSGSCLSAYPQEASELISSNCNLPYELGATALFWRDPQGFTVTIGDVVTVCNGGTRCMIEVPID